MNDTGQQEQPADPVDAKLRETLKMLRERRGWTANRLASEMGINPNYIYRIERGTGHITLAIFQRWCEAVGEPDVRVYRFVTKREMPEKTL